VSGEEASGSPDDETNGLAIASVIIGIFWLFGLGSMAAIALGYRSLRQIRDAGGSGRTLAIAGIAIGLAGLAGSALLIGFLVSASQP
jgi:uncharacterized protein DUF4190